MRLWPNRASITSWREIWRDLAGTGQGPRRTAVAVGVGLLIGLLPLMPLQTLLALGAAFAFRLNRLAVFAGTLVWQPFTAPLIIAAEYGLGRWILAAPPVGQGATVMERWGWPLAVGAPLLSLAGAVAGGCLVYLVMWVRSRQKVASSVIEERKG